MSSSHQKKRFIGEAEIACLIAHSAAEHPGISESPMFRELLAASVTHGGKDLEARAADLYLATACVAGDPLAIEILDSILPSVVRRALFGVGLPADDHDEIVQRVRVALLVRDETGTCGLAGYSGRGELRSYLRVVAVRTALKRLERETAPALNAQDEIIASLPDAGDSPELALLKKRCHGDLRTSIVSALAALTPRERTLLRQHYVDALSIDVLAKLYRVHRSTCARWIEVIRVKILRSVRSQLRTKLGAGNADVENAIAQVHSQLDLSLSRHLRSSGS